MGTTQTKMTEPLPVEGLRADLTRGAQTAAEGLLRVAEMRAMRCGWLAHHQVDDNTVELMRRQVTDLLDQLEGWMTWDDHRLLVERLDDTMRGYMHDATADLCSECS